MNKMVIKILAWVVYVLGYLGLSFVGMMYLTFYVYGIWIDSTEEENARCDKGMLIYGIAVVVLFAGGCFVLNHLLKKVLDGKKKELPV